MKRMAERTTKTGTIQASRIRKNNSPMYAQSSMTRRLIVLEVHVVLRVSKDHKLKVTTGLSSSLLLMIMKQIKELNSDQPDSRQIE